MSLLERINWRHPLTTMLLQQAVMRLVPTGPSREEIEARYREKMIAKLDALQARLRQVDNQGKQGDALIGTSLSPSLGRGGSRDDLVADARRALAEVSAYLKEAGRFAREEGVAHPEVQKRLADVEIIVTDLERYTFSPERLNQMPPEAREAARACLPEVRRLRQQVYNGIRSAEDVDSASALAGEVHTKFRAGLVVGKEVGVNPSRTTPVPASPARSQEQEHHHQHQKDVATGCIPCGKAHFGGTQANLESAVRLAKEKGIADPSVQSRLASAEEELAAMLRYDWSPEKIAVSPAGEKKVLEQFAPRAAQLREAIGAARTVEDVEALAKKAAALRVGFRVATMLEDGGGSRG